MPQKHDGQLQLLPVILCETMWAEGGRLWPTMGSKWLICGPQMASASTTVRNYLPKRWASYCDGDQLGLCRRHYEKGSSTYMDQGIQIRGPNLISNSDSGGAHLPIQLLRANWSHENGLVYEPIISQYTTTLLSTTRPNATFT